MTSTRLAAMLLAACITLGLLAIISLGGSLGVETPNLVPNHDAYHGSSLTARPEVHQAMPTLAPPRDVYLAQRASRPCAAPKGEPIIFHIETDNDEIEIGWASP
jgi:hypothetical protein